MVVKRERGRERRLKHGQGVRIKRDVLGPSELIHVSKSMSVP
jgi:hypothetical protein